MKIIITGASGFIGQALIDSFKHKNYSVSTMNRKVLYGSTTKISESLNGFDIVINLAGASILQRWSQKNKKAIYSSRVETTKNLVKAINALPEKKRPKSFITASAIGIYQAGKSHTESSNKLDSGFIGSLVKDWEDASLHLPADVKRIVFRIGMVLGKKSQTIKKMVIPFKLGLGATIGSGKQPFPFIHVDDVVSIFSEAVENKIASGTYNLVAPDNITNKDFTQTFARILKRSAFLFIPGVLLKLVFGNASDLLTKSPQVTPERLLEYGFSYKYPTVEQTLTKILRDSD